MSVLEPMLREFNEEVAITRRVLERVPEGKLDWQPHVRSMTLGQLALHIATVPAGIAHITKADSFDVSTNSFIPPSPAGMSEVLTALERSVTEVERTLSETGDDVAHGNWHLMFGEKELQCVPRIAVWRSLMLNHWYHHRGQMAVYLRMLEVPVPSIYGPSADEGLGG
jgi:uncharacterized damage-inducible protein DinB